ncbi:hypothetical protein PIB30_068472 [Stylosanthes scabra]|uniref:Uncharacterized protein n=1 Tax=Stylosanthes scabra TaxID=79078 RepID=A0ABU6YPS7_9FABA|nr:hypothetical protein [Stylosanthes scabra]
MIEETYLYDQGYTPLLHPTNTMLLNTMHTNPMDLMMHIMGMKILQILLQKRKKIQEAQKRIEAQLAILTELVHECLEEVEEENVDQEVIDEDKESKGMQIIQSASSEATPPESPSKSHIEWVNPSAMNFLGPQHYALLETNGQLRALCGELDKKKMDSLGLDKSRFITCGESEFKAYSGQLHKLHNNRTKVGALNLRKHLGPWQSQEKLVDSHSNGWTNQIWDPKKIYKNQHEVQALVGIQRGAQTQATIIRASQRCPT